jgi:hypothetical protein
LVTDKGLASFQESRQLKKLFFWHTAVTDDGVQALKKSLPNAQIVNKQ